MSVRSLAIRAVVWVPLALGAGCAPPGERHMAAEVAGARAKPAAPDAAAQPAGAAGPDAAVQADAATRPAATAGGEQGAAQASSDPAVFTGWRLDQTPLDRSAEALLAGTANHLAHARRLRGEILTASGPRTVANTLEPLNRLQMHLDAAADENALFEVVHPDPGVREAAREGSRQVAAYVTELGLDAPLHAALSGIDTSILEADTRFAIEKELRDMRRAGVDQPPAVRARIAELDQELVEQGQAFVRHISEDVRHIVVDDPARLQGLPADWIAAHPPGDDGHIRVDTTYPDYIPFMRYAVDGELRRALYLEYTNRAYPANMDVLSRLIDLRAEKAGLLGYATWADYATEDMMTGSAARAAEFIERIAAVSRPSAERDAQRLLERKRRDQPDARVVADWEKSQLIEALRAEEYGFDAQQARPYFDYERVRQGLFDVSARLFGIRFERVDGLRLWHPSVSAWDVYDGERQLGRFFLDMHPRPDKYGHAAQFDYRKGVAPARLPQSVLVCNFPDPAASPDGTALMEFSEVSTFFHEFGHLLHSLFAGHQRWAMNAGISTEWDFVEAPSQMLEEFLYEPEVLQSFAKHHVSGEPIPAEMIARLRAAADFGKGMNTAHQAFYAALSLQCYSRPPQGLDTTALVQELQARYSPFPYEPGTHFQCNFGHLEGYSAVYYTYKWSEVIAKDMYSRFAAEGVFNTTTAAEYRTRVLAAGGSKPAAALLTDFLGRQTSFAAFQAWLDR